MCTGETTQKCVPGVPQNKVVPYGEKILNYTKKYYFLIDLILLATQWGKYPFVQSGKQYNQLLVVLVKI